MPSDVVLYHSYYDENDSYDVYLTVYGGPVQNIDCKELEPYTQKIWDNSDMYNDFMLRIPQSLKGEFNVKHSDCDTFKKFCEENNMEYPQDKLEKKLTITQVTAEDVVGEMVVEYNGKRYTNNGEPMNIEVGYNKLTQIKVISTKYMIVESRTKCRVITDSPVNVQNGISWLDVDIKDNVITIKCNEKNNFADRSTELRIENTNNSRQYIKLNIKQKSGN